MMLEVTHTLPKSGIKGDIVYNLPDNQAYVWSGDDWVPLVIAPSDNPVEVEEVKMSRRPIQHKPKMNILVKILLFVALLIASPFLLGAGAIILTYAAAVAASIIGALLIVVVGFIPVGLILLPILLLCWLLSTVIERKNAKRP